MSVANAFGSGDAPYPDRDRHGLDRASRGGPEPCAAWAEALALRAAAVLSDEAASALDLHLAGCAGCTELTAEFDDLATRLRREAIPETVERPFLKEFSQGAMWRSPIAGTVVVRPSARGSSRRWARYVALLAAMVLWGIVAWWGGGFTASPTGVIPAEIVQSGMPAPGATSADSVIPETSVSPGKSASISSPPTWGDYSLALARSDEALDELLAASDSGRPMDQSPFPMTPRSNLEDLWQ